MVEALLSLALFIGAVTFASWSWAVGHDSPADGLFLTLTAPIFALIFLSKLVSQLPPGYAPKDAHRLRSWLQKRVRTFDAVRSTGGADMKTGLSKARIAMLLATILILVLAFPVRLHAREMPFTRQSAIVAGSGLSAANAQPSNLVTGKAKAKNRERTPSLMDEDIRVRAVTALMSDPTTKRLVQDARAPIRMIVITAPVILDL